MQKARIAQLFNEKLKVHVAATRDMQVGKPLVSFIAGTFRGSSAFSGGLQYQAFQQTFKTLGSFHFREPGLGK